MVSPEVAEAVLFAAVGIVLLEGFVLAFLTYRLYKKLERDRVRQDAAASPQAGSLAPADIEDVLLLHRSGDLLKHHTRHAHQYKDSEVMSGMVVTVQDFIEDSFSHGKGELSEIRFGKLRIVVLGGKWAILAAAVRGSEPYNLDAEMSAALADLESAYEDPLVGFGVTTERQAGLERIMVDLAEGRYRDRAPLVPMTAGVG